MFPPTPPPSSTGHVSSGTVCAPRWWRSRARTAVCAAESESNIFSASSPSSRIGFFCCCCCCGALPCSRRVTRGSSKHPRCVCDHLGPKLLRGRSVGLRRVAVLSVRLRVDAESCQVSSASLCFSWGGGGDKQTRVCAEQLSSAGCDGFLLSRHRDVLRRL